MMVLGGTEYHACPLPSILCTASHFRYSIIYFGPPLSLFSSNFPIVVAYSRCPFLTTCLKDVDSWTSYLSELTSFKISPLRYLSVIGVNIFYKTTCPQLAYNFSLICGLPMIHLCTTGLSQYNIQELFSNLNECL